MKRKKEKCTLLQSPNNADTNGVDMNGADTNSADTKSADTKKTSDTLARERGRSCLITQEKEK